MSIFIGQQWFAVTSPTHKGSINGRRLVPPVVRATPSDWGLGSVRPRCGRSPKPESETSLSSVVTSAGGDTKDPYCGYTSFVTSAGGDTKDPYCGYTSFVTSAGGQTNHSPQSEGVARTTGGTRRRPLIDPLWVGLDKGLQCQSFNGDGRPLTRHSRASLQGAVGRNFLWLDASLLQ